MLLRYTDTGFLVILPQDNPRRIVDAILQTGYNEEFCVSPDFSPEFIAGLMDAGFLVMSAQFSDSAGQYILLPKLHLVRSVLFFDNLHVKKSIKRCLGAYDLRFDADFDAVVDRCLKIHGDDWMTPPLISAVKSIRQSNYHRAHPVSFSLYRNGKFVAGEFGVIVGRVYTSYSGYYDESNAGTVQLILAARYLRDNGFSFFDLGMPLEYKTDLGATDISPLEFVRLFREAQYR